MPRAPRSFAHRALLLAGALALGPALHARADVYVVVQATNPQHALTQKEALDPFMGRSRAFANGDFAQMFDLPADSPVRLSFYQLLTGLSQAQINSYWSRLMFTGQTLPPQTLANEAALAEMVRRNPAAIGYLSQEPADKGLRVVLVLKSAPGPALPAAPRGGMSKVAEPHLLKGTP